jgi:O-Antigen ligase
VAVLVLRSRRLLVAYDPRQLRTGPLLAWPVLALVSTGWSLVPLFTFIRALQLLVPIGLALLMVRIWLTAPEAARAIWKDTLRLFVQVVTILIFIGLATGFWREARFTWPGAHPGVAAMYVGAAFVILLAGGRTFLALRPSGYVLRLALFGTTLYLGDTRGVLAGVLLAVGLMLWFAARTKPLKSYLGMTYYAIAGGLVLIAARPEIMTYVLRGGTTEGITSLSGRIPLWSSAINIMSDADRWFVGFGYGSARVILPKVADWAGTAHSAWVEILLAIGILGPLLLGADVLFVLRHAWSRVALAPSSVTVSLLAFLTLVSITSEGIVFPGLSFVLLALLHVPVLTKLNLEYRSHRVRAVAASGDAVASKSYGRHSAMRTPGKLPKS